MLLDEEGHESPHVRHRPQFVEVQPLMFGAAPKRLDDGIAPEYVQHTQAAARSACPDVVPEGASLRKRYERHQPENSVLYRVVQAWLETFLCMADEAYQRPLPRYVQQEFQKYLRCGILACGFARAYCSQSGTSMLVAFSCKLRGVCPSCGARRASETRMNR